MESRFRQTSNVNLRHKTNKGAFHLSELSGQPISIVMRISLLIKANHPDQSNPKYYAQRIWFLSKTSWTKLILLPKCLLRPWSGRPVLTFGKRPKFFLYLSSITVLLILLQKISSFTLFTSIRIVLDCFYSPVHVLFRKILNLCLPFTVWRKSESNLSSTKVSYSASPGTLTL